MRNLLFGAVCMAIYCPINAIADASVCEEEYRTCMEQQGMSVDEYFVTDGQDAVFLADAEMQAQLDEIKEALTGRDYPFVQSLDAFQLNDKCDAYADIWRINLFNIIKINIWRCYKICLN